eukprot:scaffold91934_cov48-Phaeocystis_antarctica.AAC.1
MEPSLGLCLDVRGYCSRRFHVQSFGHVLGVSGRWRSRQPVSACGQAGGAGARPCGLWAACKGDGFDRLLLPSTHSLAVLLLPPPVSSPPPSPPVVLHSPPPPPPPSPPRPWATRVAPPPPASPPRLRATR